MNDYIQELQAVTASAKKIYLDSHILDRLGSSAHSAMQNERRVIVSRFKYYSNSNLVSGFLVLPREPKKRLRTIIYNRGGTKDFGLVNSGQLFTFVSDFALKGYAVIGSQYPGNSLSEGKDEWGGQDILSVLDLHPIIKKLSFLDEGRIGMFGESRGGMMTYLALRHSNWIKAAVTLAGTANLLRNAQMRPEMQTVFTEAFGGSEDAKRARSARFWAEELQPDAPLLMMHGTRDARVNAMDSVELHNIIHRDLHRNNTSLEIYSHGDHGLTQYREQWRAQMMDWFRRNL